MDPHDLARFAQAQADSYSQAVRELRVGRKLSHWMWFVFPQFDGLGASATSRRFAIKSLEEAREYLRHPILGPRIRECTTIVNSHDGLTARLIFGMPDDMKFSSSMTLFELASASQSVFASALEKFFCGQRDARTLELIHLSSGRGTNGV